jgi:hypothetical protein
MSWLVLDLETTIGAHAKRKASPFNPNNYIVMMGWATKDDPKPQGRRYSGDDYGRMRVADDFIHLISNPELRFVVGCNVKFDLLHLLNSPAALEAWQDYVARGGTVWDLQLAEYIMDGQDQQSHMLSLDDLAIRYDEEMKVDEVKKLWEAGIDTPDIDPALLSRYLLGEDLPGGGRREGDIGVTRNIFLKQAERCRKEGMTRLLLLEFGALLATIEMERNGMYVDKALGLELAGKLREELADAERELNSYLPEGLPFEVNWTNRYHLSPIIFGGKIKYQRREYDKTDGSTTFDPPTPSTYCDYVFAKKSERHYILEDGSTIECSEYEDLFRNSWQHKPPEGKEVLTFKGGKHAGEFKTKLVQVDDHTKPKSRWADDFWGFPGYTKPLDEWASSTEGLYSVNADVVKTLTENTKIPFLKTLGRVVEISKDLGTYFITEDGEKGMLTLVGDDGLVHHQLNHTSTVTARFSSSNPNLQNLPKGNKSKVKQIFKSRYPDGVIIQSDFSSLEVYVQANQTHCAQLIEDLRAGIDLHCVRLAAKEHMPYDEVLKLAKGWKETAPDGSVIHHAAVQEWDYKRTAAKVYSFQRAYGAGVPTIAKATGMSEEEVQALADAEDARYPEINEFFDELEKKIEANARPTSTFVAHPVNPAVQVQLRISQIRVEDGGKLTFRSHPSPAWQLKRGVLSTFSPTERKNYIVQRGGAQIMKAAMWLMIRELYKRKNFGGRALLINTVHDAQYLDAAPEVKEEAAALLHACMTVATSYWVYWHKTNWEIAVPTDTTWGPSMADDENLPDAVLEKAAAIVRELRQQYGLVWAG